MQGIDIKPYLSIENQEFLGDVIFIIDAKTFSGENFKDGRITFSFIGCKFKKIIIQNSEKIEFEDISIQFLSCYIKDIQIESITSRNISILFLSSIWSGRISSPNLLSLTINNCIIENGIFLIDQQKVNISYSEENIFPHYCPTKFTLPSPQLLAQ